MDKDGLKEQRRYSVWWWHQRKKDVREPGQEQRLASEPLLSLFWPGPSESCAFLRLRRLCEEGTPGLYGRWESGGAMDTAEGKPWLCGGMYYVSVDSSDSNRLSTTSAAEEKAKWL